MTTAGLLLTIALNLLNTVILVVWYKSLLKHEQERIAELKRIVQASDAMLAESYRTLDLVYGPK